ncbi:MAG: hypothetical protein PHD43_19055 [Methylococcales bacterium]|nr:hypothetical protein [Methylococcales bacterium]
MVNLAERKGNRLLIDKIDLVREVFVYTKQRHSYRMDAVVILPDHLYSTAWPVSVPFQTGISAIPGSQMQEVEHQKQAL